MELSKCKLIKRSIKDKRFLDRITTTGRPAQCHLLDTRDGRVYRGTRCLLHLESADTRDAYIETGGLPQPESGRTENSSKQRT